MCFKIQGASVQGKLNFTYSVNFTFWFVLGCCPFLSSPSGVSSNSDSVLVSSHYCTAPGYTLLRMILKLMLFIAYGFVMLIDK